MNPLALRFGFGMMRFVWAIWLAPYRIAIVMGIALLMLMTGLVWRWVGLTEKHVFGIDINADLFFASSLLVAALLVAIVVPATIFIVIGAVWRVILERTDEQVKVIRDIMKQSLYTPAGLAYLAMNYRGVIIEAYDLEIIRRQLAKEEIDIAERQMLMELRRLGAHVLHEVEMVNIRFRQLKLGNMHRVIYDPKHGGGFLYYHVHANQYLLGVAIEIEPLESKDGQLPPANQGMEELTKRIRNAQGLAPRKPRMSPSAPTPSMNHQPAPVPSTVGQTS